MQPHILDCGAALFLGFFRKRLEVAWLRPFVMERASKIPAEQLAG
jgi:hypothetical protein